MMFFVYFDGHFVGTVIAADEAEASQKAFEKFEFTDHAIIEVKPRPQKRALVGG